MIKLKINKIFNLLKFPLKFKFRILADFINRVIHSNLRFNNLKDTTNIILSSPQMGGKKKNQQAN